MIRVTANGKEVCYKTFAEAAAGTGYSSSTIQGWASGEHRTPEGIKVEVIRPIRIYMRVGLDKYHLPEAIADTAAAMARISGTTTGVVESTVSKYKHGRIDNPRYVMVEVDDDDRDKKG